MTKEQFITFGITEEQATKTAEESKNEIETYVPKTKFDNVSEENKNLKATVKENKLKEAVLSHFF